MRIGCTPLHAAVPKVRLAAQAGADGGQGGPLAQTLAVIGPPAAAARWRAWSPAPGAGAVRGHAQAQPRQRAGQQSLSAAGITGLFCPQELTVIVSPFFAFTGAWEVAKPAAVKHPEDP